MPESLFLVLPLRTREERTVAGGTPRLRLTVHPFGKSFRYLKPYSHPITFFWFHGDQNNQKMTYISIFFFCLLQISGVTLKKNKILRSLTSFFLFDLFSCTYTNTHIHLCSKVVIWHWINPLPLEMILNSGILEGWTYFFKITMVLKIIKGGPYFFCITLIFFFYFFKNYK